MAIAVVRGATASLAVGGTTLAFVAASQSSGDITVISIAILDTTKSVSSISDGTNLGVFRSAQNDSTAVRVEQWTLPIASSATRTITINFSGTTLASAAYEEYSGTTGIGHLGAGGSGTGQQVYQSVATQDTSSWAVAAIAIASSSGDTVAAITGTNRQSVIPALTTSGAVLMDNTSIAAISLINALNISASRGWASVALELRTGVAATVITSPSAEAPVTNPKSPAYHQTVKPPAAYGIGGGGAVPIPVASLLKGGTVGVAYSETISAQGGVLPYTFTLTAGSLPAGLSLASGGVISGTPTTAATSSFTVTVTDATLSTGSTAFQITIAVAPSSGGGSFVFVA